MLSRIARTSRMLCGALQANAPRRMVCAAPPELKNTPLAEWHKEKKAVLKDFAGWNMPFAYQGRSNVKTAFHTRDHAALFDVSHMQPIFFRGEMDDVMQFVERATVIDFERVPVGSGGYTLLLNENGGIIDDTVITLLPDEVYMREYSQRRKVCNASRADVVLPHLRKLLDQWNSERSSSVSIEAPTSNYGLLAIQGPDAQTALQPLCEDALDRVSFMNSQRVEMAGTSCIVTRCGYTGEDGFEIFISGDNATVEVADALERHEFVEVAGLITRDILRLEAGLPLYGKDIDEATSPIEAGLSWTISQRRRGDGGEFVGYQAVMSHLNDGVSRRRIGFLLDKSGASDGDVIATESGEEIGRVTSAIASPVLKKGVGMGYVRKGFTKNGTTIRVGAKGLSGEIAKMPFVKTHYYKAPVLTSPVLGE